MESHGKLLFLVTLSLTALSLLTVLVRGYTRKREGQFKLDDWLTTAAFVGVPCYVPDRLFSPTSDIYASLLYLYLIRRQVWFWQTHPRYTRSRRRSPCHQIRADSAILCSREQLLGEMVHY
jgi:hypothetical protein